MRFYAIFNILYTSCKFQKTLKNNLTDSEESHKQFSNS